MSKAYEATKRWLAKHPGYKKQWYAKNKAKAKRTKKAWLKENPEYSKKACAKNSKKRRQLFIRLKNKPCMDCGKSFPACAMEFDHRSTRSKKNSVGNLYQSSMAKLLREIKKCDLVCALCHRLRTCKRRGHDH